jgi:hypothetical protein
VVRDRKTTLPLSVLPVTLCRTPPAQTQVRVWPDRTDLYVGEKKLLPTRTVLLAVRVGPRAGSAAARAAGRASAARTAASPAWSLPILLAMAFL